MGNYPVRRSAKIPAAFVVVWSSLGESIGRFTDVAPQAGLNLFAMASGVIVDDFENNGLLDVVTSNYERSASRCTISITTETGLSPTRPPRPASPASWAA